MSLARERHVELARQAHANRPSCLEGTQGGDARPRVGLDLLAAEGAAHSKTLDRDGVTRQPEDARDDVLRLGRMLGGGVHGHAAGLVNPGDAGLRFQVEVLLAADRDLALDAQRARLDDGDVAARQVEKVREIAVGVDGLLDREDRGKRLVRRRHPGGAPLCGVERVGQDPRNRLPVKHDLARKQRLVVAIRAAVAFARHVGRR